MKWGIPVSHFDFFQSRLTSDDRNMWRSDRRVMIPEKSEWPTEIPICS